MTWSSRAWGTITVSAMLMLPIGQAAADRLLSQGGLYEVGDGSYIFSNPTACHQIAEALQLPLLVLILNNAEWGAVRHSVLDVYPDGYASRSNAMPLISLEPSPDFEKIAEASRAYVQRVETPDGLPFSSESDRARISQTYSSSN